MNETPHRIAKAGTYYGVFVITQAVLLVAFMILWACAPDDRSSARTHFAYSTIHGSLKTAMGMFDVDCGRYPTSAEGLKVLISLPADGSLTNWRGPYLEPPAPKDPWGHEYVYRFPAVYGTNEYDLYSLGPDGESKSGGNDPDDINNWARSPSSARATLATSLYRNEKWLLLIPLLFLVGVITQLAFPNVRRAAGENEWVDWLWLAISVIAFYVALLMPRISG